MKKLIILLALPFIIFQGCSQETRDFRNINWDMSEREVKENEQGQFTRNYLNDVIYEFSLKGKVKIGNGLNAELIYYFIDNRVKRAAYIVSQEDNPDKPIIREFERIKNDMEIRYGKYITFNGPYSKLLNWHDNNNRVTLTLLLIDTFIISYEKM